MKEGAGHGARPVSAECCACHESRPLEDMAGYNIRLGRVEQAICHPCVAVYEGPGRPRPGDWHTRVIQKITKNRNAAQKKQKERRSRPLDGPGWSQEKLEGVE